MSIEEIYKQIQILNEQARLLNKNKDEEQIVLIKKLDWTKDVDARLEFTQFWSVGLPKYRIILSGKCPEISRTFLSSVIQVFGDDNYYQNNIQYTNSWTETMNNAYNFYTSSDNTLIEFLKTVKFKSLKYDIGYFNILNIVNKLYGESND